MASLGPNVRDLVIRTILAEAGNEPPEGQAAVANVIKNRVDSGVWGEPLNSVGRVIKARDQFSPWNNDPKMQAYAAQINAIPTTDPKYQRAGQIADAVFSEDYADNTGGATHFYAPSGMPNGQPPDWAIGQTGRIIGSQRFYKLPLKGANVGGSGVTTPSAVPAAAPAPPAAPAVAPAVQPRPVAPPVAAVAPAAGAPAPAAAQSPPAAIPGAPEANDRFQVLQNMGGLPITAINLAPGAGTPAPGPISTAQNVPLDQTPMPPPRPSAQALLKLLYPAG